MITRDVIVRVLLALTVLVRSAYATDCDPAEAAELRALLTRQHDKGNAWNLGWRLTFTATTVATLSVAVLNPYPELRDGMFVSAGKSALAAANRWIFPLRVYVPDANADACADLKALRAELVRVGQKEKAFFWMGHIGGIAVNLGGAAIIWYRAGLGQAALSIAFGYPIGLIQTYTMPRGAWHRWRDTAPTWTVGVMPTESGWQAVLGGSF